MFLPWGREKERWRKGDILVRLMGALIFPRKSGRATGKDIQVEGVAYIEAWRHKRSWGSKWVSLEREDMKKSRLCNTGASGPLLLGF